MSPLRDSKRLHQLSKRWAESQEVRGLAGIQALGEFMKYDADLWRKASAYKGLRKSASYCFEKNALLLAVLTQLGFDAGPLSARVRYQRPRDFTPARTHLFVRVELDESWLADVGVGAMSLTCALRLAETGPQTTPHEPRRLLREHGLIYHQVQLGEQWHDVCEFTLEEMPPIDRVVANWYTSTHPGSHFKNRLLVARALPDGGRVGLLNRELSVRQRGGASERRVLHSPDELLTALAEHFGLHLPAGTRFACDALDWPA